MSPPPPDLPAAASAARDLEAEAQQLRALQRRAQEGDVAALGELRKVLDADPGWWERTGDVAHQAELAWLKTYAGTDEYAKEVISRKLRALRQELLGPTPTALERLLVARIGLCWLTLHYFETLYADRMRRPEGLSLETSTHCQERIDRSHRRYLSAIRALATLRRVSITATAIHVQLPTPTPTSS